MTFNYQNNAKTLLFGRPNGIRFEEALNTFEHLNKLERDGRILAGHERYQTECVWAEFLALRIQLFDCIRIKRANRFRKRMRAIRQSANRIWKAYWKLILDETIEDLKRELGQLRCSRNLIVGSIGVAYLPRGPEINYGVFGEYMYDPEYLKLPEGIPDAKAEAILDDLVTGIWLEMEGQQNDDME